MRHSLICVLAFAAAAAGHIATASGASLSLSGTPGTTAYVGRWYAFQPSVYNPSGRALTFTVANRPRWMSFLASTGHISKTPTSDAVGSYSNIQICGTDGITRACLKPFTLNVLASTATTSGTSASTASLTISGTPPTTATAGSAYSFVPSAKDSLSGAVLTYSVVNKPAWAVFNTSSGALSGTPAAANVGTYSGIAIKVSDGKTSASLSSFTLTVNAAGSNTGSATVSWTPPTQNSDGSTLTNLGGYYIYYGTSKSDMSRSIKVSGTALTSYTIADLSPATWYFRIQAYTTSGTQSAMSNVGSKSVY